MGQLCKAVHSGDVKQVKYLLQVENVDPNHREDKHDSILATACSKNNLDIVQLLITNQNHPADPNGCGGLPFVVALKLGNVELVNLLLNESILNVQLNRVRIRLLIHESSLRRYIVTALTLAILKQDLLLVKTLLDAGADSNLATAKDAAFYGYSPLACAIKGGNVDICRELFRYECDPNAIPVTSIFDAIKPRVSTQAVNILIEQGDFAIRHQDILLDLLIKHHRDENLEHCLQHIYNHVGENVQGWKQDFVQKALSCWSPNCLRMLLRWGFYTFHHTSHSGEITPDDRRSCTVHLLKLLVEFNQMYLQESWFMSGKITQRCFESGNENEIVTITELMEARKNAPPLQVLCRTKIIQHLSYNPLWKAQKLPLPTALKEYVQLKNVDVVYRDLHLRKQWNEVGMKSNERVTILALYLV